MEDDSRDFRQHLADEQWYARHHLKRLGNTQQQLREEMLDSTETHTSTHSERWDPYSYHTQQSAASPLAKYLRTTAEGQEQVVLDVNQVEAKSGFVGIGQIKLSPDQQMVAYTVDTANGSEAYETQSQPKGLTGF